MPDPLLTVLRLAKDAEEQAGLQLRTAQLERQKSQEQLTALNHYRTDYLQTLKTKQQQQLSGVYYQQLYKFINQIDKAINQQLESISKLEQVCQQRQQSWLDKRQKSQAVELLLEKKAQQRQFIENRQEQKMLDEFSMQQFYRHKF